MRKTILVVYIVLIAGCANPNYQKNKQLVESATAKLTSCLGSGTNHGKKADCAQEFYFSLLAVSNDDYGKIAALRMATTLYTLMVKIDRKQIIESDAKLQLMQIFTDLQTDLNEAQRRSIADNRAAALQQQKMFINAQRLLSPPGSIINCYRTPGNFVTTCY